MKNCCCEKCCNLNCVGYKPVLSFEEKLDVKLSSIRQKVMDEEFLGENISNNFAIKVKSWIISAMPKEKESREENDDGIFYGNSGWNQAIRKLKENLLK